MKKTAILRKFLAIFSNLTIFGALFYFAFATTQLTLAAEQKEETVEGTLEVLHSDNFVNKKSETHYFIKTSTERSELEFASEKPTAKSGSKVRVKGVRKGNKLAVGSGAFQLTLMPAPVPAIKKIAVLLFNFQNDTSQPYTVDQARTAMFTSPVSANFYYQENSFNNVSLNGDAFGWYTIPYDNTGCDYLNWAQAARNSAISSGVDLSGYTNIIYGFTSPSCNWGGLAYVPGSEAWINVAASYIEEVGSHEFGHNLGAHHASSYSCVDPAGNRVSISNNCTQDEYGDPFDVMGFPYNSFYHFNNFHKGEVGWFVDTNTQTATASGTFNIVPIESSSSAVQALRIPKDRDASGNPLNYYYVEYRQSIGFDYFKADSAVVNGISIRIAPEYNQIIETKLIDTTPDTLSFTDAPLTLGRSFTDPAKNITITLTGLTSSAATVQITILPPDTCVRANPTVTLSPTTQTGVPGQKLSYTVSITNNDTLTCNTSSFTITPILPLQLTQTPNSFQQTIAPGITVNSPVSITSNINSADGSFSFTELAVNDAVLGYGGSGSSQYLIYSIDTIPPIVSLTQPVDGSLVFGIVNVLADASDASGIQKVEFYADNNLVGTSTSAPYSTNWDSRGLPSNSSHILFAKAFDNANNTASSSAVTVTISDQISPTVSIISPVNGANVSGLTTITASASDDIGVSKVEVYVDGSLQGTVYTSPYSVVWDTTGFVNNSIHTIVAKAYDAASNMGTSSTVTVTVKDTKAPTVAITSPANGSQVSRNTNVTIAASALDISGISKVEFYVNNSLKCTDTTASYSCRWSVPSGRGITYTLMAKAFDIAGNTATVTSKVTTK